MNQQSLSAFLWSVADLLRGDYKQSDYGKVILPFTVLRRIDCALAPTKAAVLDELALRQSQGLPPDAFLRRKSGQSFYNASPLDLKKLTGDQDNIGQNLRAYIHGFSPEVRDIFDRFEFDIQIDRLSKAGLLYQVTEKFTQIDLHPDKVTNHQMGLVFEELIRRFAELSNETAGEHFTPREVIRLMVDLIFAEDGVDLAKPSVVRTIYDPTAGTGGMLSVAEEYLTNLNPTAQVSLFGQELNPESYAICKADMLIKGQDIANIIFGNTLSADGLICIPMLARNRVIGVIVCGLSEKQYARLQRRIPWLANFGKIAAISLDAVFEANQHRQQVEAELTQQFTRQARQIVHEAGNPLGIIKSYLSILERKLPEDGVRQELAVLTEEIDRVANIVGHMTQSIKTSPDTRSIDLVSVLNDFLLLYSDTLFSAKGIRVETALAQVKLPIQINRDNLKQIVLNLWKNASEALGEGKRIKISVSDNIIHDGASYVQLRVDDNGPGMSEETIQAIYRPKPISDTSQRGIGLSVVGSLAKREGILITCRSQIGAGTSIALLIPKNRAATTSSSA